MALAWLLQRPVVTSVIIGGRNYAQFDDNLKAAELKLSDEEVAKLDGVSRPPLIYPYWHQSFTAQDRLSEEDWVLHEEDVVSWWPGRGVPPPPPSVGRATAGGRQRATALPAARVGLPHQS